jgi:tRNA-dihydrouridine synthase 3
VPVIGNGDVLTGYEARERMRRTGVRSVMLGRGALIKPWLFRELKTGETWLPSAEERFSLLWRFVELLREHFGADERGTRRALRFLPWHLNFFCRYVPLPEARHAEAAREHPLIQSRLQPVPGESPLERLLADARPAVHERFAVELLAAESREEALERALRLQAVVPEGDGGDLRLSTSEVAG